MVALRDIAMDRRVSCHLDQIGPPVKFLRINVSYNLVLCLHNVRVSEGIDVALSA